MVHRKLKRPIVVQISGHSMFPTYQDGDTVYVDPCAYHHSPPQCNDVVLALHPYKRGTWIVKRVTQSENNERLFLEGDNRWESSDSRSFGSLPLQNIKGKVIGKKT